MEKKYFPIFIDISDKKIVVVGGGNIATRRVSTLLHFTKQIIVVAPEITSEMRKLVDEEQVKWVCSEYRQEQILDAHIVIAATNQPQINHQVRNDCKYVEKTSGHSILVSVADDKELCDFYFPGIVKNDEIVIGISSSGKSPAKVKALRRRMENLFKRNDFDKEL